MVQLIDGILEAGEKKYDLLKLSEEDFPSVDIVIPVHNVTASMLEETLEGCVNLTYPNFQVWIGDDYSLPKYSEKAKELAEKYTFHYYRANKRSFKSGVINQVVSKSKADYIVIFDADQIPTPDIIDHFVAFLEQYPEYAFVQAKYEYRNISNLLHVYETMATYQLFCAQAGKRNAKAVLFYGMCACFRREWIYPLPENKLAEDFDHYITIAAQGQYGYFMNKSAARGLSTESFEHKMSQMFRWTKGQIGAVFDHFKDFFKSKMGIKQRIDLFLVTTFILILTAFYFMGGLYLIMYVFKIPLYRALGIDKYAPIIMPVLIGIVYFAIFIAVGVYSSKSKEFDFHLWHVIYFMSFGGLMAPFLLIPLFQGILGQNKIKENKKFQWNQKIRLNLFGTLFSLLGLAFMGLAVLSFLDSFGLAGIHYYGPNFLWFAFFSMGFMLMFALPFVLIAKKVFKKPQYYLEEETLYY